MPPKGQNIENVKIINRASTLKLLLTHGPMSRSEIAAELSITPATLTSICKDFLSKGILVQNDERTSSGNVGRKKCPVELNYDYKYVIAVNIESVSTTISLCNLSGALLDSITLEMDKSLPPEKFLSQMAERCIKLLWDNHLESDRMLGVGVTVLGPVNHHEGISLNAFSIWNRPVPVQRILEDELHIPVCVESNVCALADASLLYGETTEPNVLAVQWGPGVGSASIIAGELFKGRNCQTAELGHNFIDAKGKKCRCGKIGCLETHLSVDAIVFQLEKLSNSPRENPLRDLESGIGPPSRKNIQAYLNVPFPALEEYLDTITFRLAVVVNNAIQVLAPDHIILFGDLFSNDLLFERFKRGVFSINETIVDDMFLRSALHAQRAYIGAVACVVRKFLVDTGGA